MVEKYIYTRSERNFLSPTGAEINVGHGFVAWSQGVSQGEFGELRKYCSEYECNYVAENGQALELTSRYYLPEQDKVVLQRMQWVAENQRRGYCYASGYLIDGDSSSAVQPELWAQQSYPRRSQSELEQLTLTAEPQLTPSASRTIPTLAAALEEMGMNVGQFQRLVRACFDCVNWRSQCFISVDWSLPQEELRRRQENLLVWVYRFLPLYLRRVTGYASVYTARTVADKFHIVFLPNTEVTYQERRDTVRLNGIRVRSNYILEGGRFHHTPREDAEEFCGASTPYGRWLDEMIAQAAGLSEGETAPFLAKLEEAYAAFHRELSGLEPSCQSDPAYYDAVYWNLASSGAGLPAFPQADAAARPNGDEELACFSTLLRMGRGEGLLQGMDAQLDALSQRLSVPLDKRVVELLTQLLHRDYGPQRNERIWALMVKAVELEFDEGMGAGAVNYYARLLAGPRYTDDDLRYSYFEHILTPASGRLDRWMVDELRRVAVEGVSGLVKWMAGEVTRNQIFQPELRQNYFKSYQSQLPQAIHFDPLAKRETIQLAVQCIATQEVEPELTEQFDQFAMELLRHLLRGYRKQLPQLTVTLEQLAGLNRHMSALPRRKIVEEIWQAEYLLECSAVAKYDQVRFEQASGLDQPPETASQVLQRLEQAVLKQPGSEHAAELDSAGGNLFCALCRCIFQHPQSFMNAQWLAQVKDRWPAYAPGGLHKTPGEVMGVCILAAFAQPGAAHDRKRLNQLCKKGGVKDEKRLWDSIYQLYMSGALPELSLDLACLIQTSLGLDGAALMWKEAARCDFNHLTEWMRYFMKYNPITYPAPGFDAPGMIPASKKKGRKGQPVSAVPEGVSRICPLLMQLFTAGEWMDRYVESNPDFLEMMMEYLMQLEEERQLSRTERIQLNTAVIEYANSRSKMGKLMGGMKYRKYVN